MTKDIDVSKIDVGWRVQLNTADWALYRELMGEWVTIIEKPKPGRVAFIHNGQAVMLSLIKSSFLAALPPEPAKDPFAVGEWVVCVKDGKLAKSGDILRVDGLHLASHYFVSNGSGFDKASFRPATPEEIARHVGWRHDGEELKADLKGRCDDGPEGDGKITFTVAGREFFVGQRVWATLGVHGRCVIGDGLVICGELEGLDKLSVRKPDSHLAFAIHPTMVSAVAHEWQFADQASHPDHGTVLVIDMTEPGAFQCASLSDPEIFIDPAELTFIRRTDLGA